jgi:hypothetical protein
MQTLAPIAVPLPAPARLEELDEAALRASLESAKVQTANVSSTADGIASRRTPQEILRIVYLTDKTGISKSGFHPRGMNGEISRT